MPRDVDVHEMGEEGRRVNGREEEIVKGKRKGE